MVLERSSARQPRSTLGLLPRGSADNRSTWMLSTRLNLSRNHAFEILKRFWNRARRERLLLRVRGGTGYGLNLDKLRVVDGSRRPMYECSTCGTRTFRSARVGLPILAV